MTKRIKIYILSFTFTVGMSIAYITGFKLTEYPRPLFVKNCCNVKIHKLRTFIGYVVNPNKPFHRTIFDDKTGFEESKNITDIIKNNDTFRVFYRCKRMDSSFLGFSIITESSLVPYFLKIREKNVILLNAIGALAAKIAGKKVIVDLMDLWTCSYDSIYFNALDFMALKRVDHVIAWSRAIKSVLVMHGIKRVSYVPFGVNLKIFDPLRVSNDLFFEKFRDLDGKFLIGYSGGMWFVNGIDRLGVEKLIAAFKEIESGYRNEVFLVLQTTSKVLPILRKYGIKNYVFVKPTVFYDPLRLSLLRSLHIRVLTATKYPPVYFAERSTMFQYMASGGAILAEGTPGNSGVLRHGYNAYIVGIDDVQALANGLRVLIEDHKLRSALGYNARRDVEEKYSWDVLSNVYRSVVSSVFDL